MVRLKFIWIITCVSFVLGASMPNLRSDYTNPLRNKRSVPTRNNCESWSSWVNNHLPTTTDKNDTDSMTPSDLDAFCPYAVGGNITRMECVDDRGEPFTGVLEDHLHRYRIRCDNISVGVACTVYDNTWERHCPDLSVRYYCTCSKQAMITSKVHTKTPTSVSRTAAATTSVTTLAATTHPVTIPAATTPSVATLAATTPSVTTPAATTPSITTAATTTRLVTTLAATTHSVTTLATTTLAAKTQAVTTSQSASARIRAQTTTTQFMDEMRTESSKGDGTLHIDPNIFFYSSVATASCLLALITMSCIITCLLCKRNNGSQKEDDSKLTKVRPF